MTKEFFEDYKKLQVKIKKISKNSKGVYSSYADLPHIWDNVRQVVVDCNFVVYSFNTLNGVTTILQHESGKNVESTVPFTTELEPQKRGSEITYFRRYNLLSLLHIMIEGEDDDAQSTKKQVNQVNNQSNSGDEFGL